MNTPLRWGGLKVHAPREGAPPPERNDRRRRPALPAADKRPPAVVAGPGTRQAPAAPPEPATRRRAAGDARARPPAVPLPDGGLPADTGPDVEAVDASAGWVPPAGSRPEPTQAVSGPSATEDPDDAAAGRALVAYVSGRVAAFCNNPAVREADGWHIRIELSDSILASTTLHLKLTLHWLILRFECRDALARRLVLAHGPSLKEALEGLVSPRRDISLDVD